jgi:hypothetical protein
LSAQEIVDVEAEEVPGTELVPHAPQPVNLFRTEDPNEVISKATATADALARVVREKNLASNISGREHVRVEGWTLLGSMLGVFAVCTETRKLEDGWQARVEARTLSGALVGAAEAECLRSEKNWKNRDDYALLSMAQTRATSKALRQPLGFVMTLAGFEATPDEEIPRDETPPELQGDPDPKQVLRGQLTVIFKRLNEQAPKQEGQESWAETLQAWCYQEFGKADSMELSEGELRLLVTHANGLLKEEGLETV